MQEKRTTIGVITKWLFSNLRYVVVVVYAILFLVAMYSFTCANFFPIEAANARYMLSALAQSQAAIIALVITLSLVAVQVTASAYSPHIIRLFRRNRTMWILLGLYAISICWSLLVLQFLKTEPRVMNLPMANQSSSYIIHTVNQSSIWYSIPISFENLVLLSFWLGVVTFIALFYYMRSIFTLLDPKNILEELAKDAKREIARQEIGDYNPLQPLMDVTHEASLKQDIATIRMGLKKMMDVIKALIDDTPTVKDTWKDNFFKQYLPRDLQHVCKLFANADDEDSIIEDVIKTWGGEDKDTTNKCRNDVVYWVVLILKAAGKGAVNSKLENAALSAVKSLSVFGEDVMNRDSRIAARLKKNTFDGSDESVRSNDESVRSDITDIAKEVATALGVIGIAAMEQGEDFKKVANEAKKYLERIKKEAIGQQNLIVENEADSWLDKLQKTK
jgi:hypothetical protein